MATGVYLYHASKCHPLLELTATYGQSATELEATMEVHFRSYVIQESIPNFLLPIEKQPDFPEVISTEETLSTADISYYNSQGLLAINRDPNN